MTGSATGGIAILEGCGCSQASNRLRQAYRVAKHLHLGGHPWLNPLTMDGKVGRLPAMGALVARLTRGAASQF